MGNAITVNQSQMQVYQHLWKNLTNCNGQFSPDFDDIWRPETPGVQDQRPADMAAMDNAMVQFIQNPMAQQPPNGLQNLIGQVADRAWGVSGSKYRKVFYKYMTTNLICMAKTGQITDAKLSSIAEQIKEELKVALDISLQDLSSLFKALMLIITAGSLNAVKIMRGNLGNIGLDDASRFYRTMVQSVYSGVTGVTVVADAMAKFPCARVWKYLSDEATIELNRWVVAARVVATNGFVAFAGHAQRDLVKSTLFPNLFYAAQTILLELGGESNIKGIRTTTKAGKKIFIDKLIKADKNEALAGLNAGEYEFESDRSMLTFVEDMPSLLTTLTT